MSVSFQKERRVFAGQRTTGPFYIVTDDDCLPTANSGWIAEAIDILERHPDFAILSLWPSNATIQRWTPEDYSPFEDAEVMEHIDVGGVRVCRHISLDWPEQTHSGYDREHCSAIRDKGFRVGYYRNLKMLHLGEGQSSLPR